MEASPSHGTPCSPSPERYPTFSNDDAVAPMRTMTTMWRNDDGDDDGGDGDRRTRTAHAGAGNRILQAWILL